MATTLRLEARGDTRPTTPDPTSPAEPTSVDPPVVGAAITDGRRWAFIGSSSLPDDPEARRLERRGRRMLILSFVLCPCHLPVTMALLGVALGGTALGSVIAGNGLWVGVVLGVLYGLALWRSFRTLRRAKALAGPGGGIRCTPDGCEVVPADASTADGR